MYRQLLLSTGGGIISNNQKDQQAECVTLAIGLGGTGVSCLRNLKRQVYERLQADDPKEITPSYSHIKFLAVDTDKSSLEADGKINSLDEVTEYFDISSPDIGGLLASTRLLAGHPECDWLKTANPEKGEPGLKILSATAGAGGVREIGRLLLIQRSDAFVNKVSQLVNEAKKGFTGTVDVNVHIFTGLGGGTGSGTFLDVCYLVQKALNDIGEGGHALTCGYFFLPDVNLSVPQVAAKTDVSAYIMSNGFAAMKELDYCMNFETNGGSWDQQYKGFHFGPVRSQPVKCCHLISANATNGASLKDGYNYAMNVVGDFVMQFLVENDIKMTSHISNYYSAMGQVAKECGANYQYVLLGASSAVVPMREITTYLASRLFESLSDVQQNVPTDQEILDFATDNDLTFQKLLRLVMNKTTYNMPAIALDEKMFGDMGEQDLGTDQLILPMTIMQPYRNLQNKMLTQVEVNVQALTHDWKREKIQEEHNNISRVWHTFYSLGDVVKDPKKGPFYASVVLNGSGRKNLVDILNGDLVAVNSNLKQVSGDMQLRMQEVKAARHAFLKGGFMANKKKLFATFVASVANYFTDDSKIQVLTKMQSMLHKMIDQFTKLYKDYFEPYQKVSQELIDTFHENYQTISNGTILQALNDPFIMPLLEMDENMLHLLDQTVEKMDMDQEKSRFNYAFFNADSAWYNNEEGKIVKFVSDYIITAFNDYTQKTITNYLQMRFNTTDPGVLESCVYKDIMRPLSNMATPLFWKKSTYAANQGHLGYISIPDEAAVITAAANRLITENPDLKLVKSKFANRIFLMRCLCGVPMFAYNGVDLYSQKYFADKSVGKHLYEYTARDPRDWRTLSNLRPYSTVERPTPEMRSDEEAYNRAVELGIIRQNPMSTAEYQMVEYAQIDEIREMAQQASDKQNQKLAVQVKAAIDEYLASREPVKRSIILNDGAPGNEEKVRKDHVMDSAVMLKAIREQLGILDELDQIRDRMDHLGSLQSVADTFRNAMFTGVFTFAPPKVLFTKVKMGMKKEMVLTDASMQPFGRLVPIYQAYKTYAAMPDEERKEVNKLVEDRLNDLDKYAEDCKTACDKLETTFNDRYMGMMQMNAQKVPSETELIEEFLVEFRQEIENFRMMYGIM